VSRETPTNGQLLLFLFDAFDPQRSVPVRGSWWAHSEEQAEFWLQNKGYTHIQLRVSTKLLSQVRVERGSLVFFYRQVATMFRAGIPLYDALSMASDSSDRHLTGICLMLSDRIASGYQLSEAMALFPRVFDSVVVGLVGASERSGRLHETLSRLADTEEKRDKLRRNMISAAIYPALLTGATLVLTFIFFFYVFPINQKLFGTMNLELPFFGQVITGLARFLGSPWTPVLLLVFGGIAYATFREDSARKKLLSKCREICLAIPVLGSVVEKSQALAVLSVLDLVLSGGGTADSALKFMMETSPDESRRRLFRQVRKEVMEGADFSQALGEYGVFPPLVTSLIQVGYETGQLERMARYGIAICEADVQHAIDTAMSLIEPVLLTFSGFIAGLAIISSALPLLQLIQSL